jgi:hypothetical protein
VLEVDLADLRVEARWTTLAKVITAKPFSHVAFLAHIKYAWSLAKDVRFKAIEENLFMLQFFCLGDLRDDKQLSLLIREQASSSFYMAQESRTTK